MPQILCKLLVKPCRVHQSLPIRVQSVMTLVQTRVHLWPIEILSHAPSGPRYDGGPLVCPVRMFLHVLGKIGFLCVALATVGTDVCLYMLGLLVLGDVLKQ